MDNSFMVGLSAQQVLRLRMDTTANNLANMSTIGFKAEQLVMRPLSEKPAAAADTPRDIAFVDAWALQRDLSTGAIQRTGNPLDAAIEGPGFFVLQTPAGPAYTRDGRFALSPGGQLVSRDGFPVLAGGAPVTLDPAGDPVVIGPDGLISQGEVAIGRFDVVDFFTPAALEKIGENMWRATDEQPSPAQNYRVAGASLENSNVNAVAELTTMIEISRTYESVSKLIAQSDDLRSASIDKLARVG
jgi:flagellar basal-body rod protein FlgF